MRISGGTAAGVRLQSLAGDAIRPATDGMRQAVFSSLGNRVAGATVLDLFAGTGSYGLEAASRGARSILFVEKGAPASRCIQTNWTTVAKSLAAAGRTAEYRMQTADVFRWLQSADGQWDLIFADPPYAIDDTHLHLLLELVAPLLKPSPESRIILELPGDRPLEPPPQLTLVRRLGKPRRNQPNCCILCPTQ